MNYHQPPHPLWCLTQTSLEPSLTKHYEGLFTQGSGYLHLRASYEEGLAAAPQNQPYMRMPANVTVETPRHPRSKAGCYIPGVTGLHPFLREEMVNLPNPVAGSFSADGRALDMDSGAVRDFCRTLDLRDGVLYRSFVWDTPSGAVECGFTRFVSRAQPGLVVQRMDFCAAAPTRLHLSARCDHEVTTNGYNHFARVEPFAADGCFGAAVDTDTSCHVEMASLLSVPAALTPGAGEAVLELGAGQTVTVWRLTLAATDRDDAPPSRAEMTARLHRWMQDPAALYAPHAALWAAMWAGSHLVIEGDDEAQLAVNLSLYHLLRAANPADSRVAVCAKGFAGEAYFGHFFWDTEMYLLPFFLYTAPDTARSLMQFRIGTLAGAERNAARYGYPGARYPWESSVTGDEQCPNWQYCDHEVHVTADVAFGLWHTFRATGDTAFLQAAMPVLAQTARYWLARCHTDPDGSVHINGVMGPDEYICLCSDNAYTNTLVARTLEYTLEAARLTGSTLLSAEEQRQIRTVADRLAVHRRADGILLQCREFEQFEDPDFAALWPDRSRPFGACVSQERNYRTKALKQADVLMLPYLFPGCMDADELERTYAYYYPLTTHDSSLSYIVHAILQARMGHPDEARRLFGRSIGIDLDGGAAEGIHIANCGGIWQGVVLGFCGMQSACHTDRLHFVPHLPGGWKRVAFSVVWHGQRRQVEITPDAVRIDGEVQP